MYLFKMWRSQKQLIWQSQKWLIWRSWSSTCIPTLEYIHDFLILSTWVTICNWWWILFRKQTCSFLCTDFYMCMCNVRVFLMVTIFRGSLLYITSINHLQQHKIINWYFSLFSLGSSWEWVIFLSLCYVTLLRFGLSYLLGNVLYQFDLQLLFKVWKSQRNRWDLNRGPLGRRAARACGASRPRWPPIMSVCCLNCNSTIVLSDWKSSE